MSTPWSEGIIGMSVKMASRYRVCMYDAGEGGMVGLDKEGQPVFPFKFRCMEWETEA